jgi:WD40 repeat protein
MAPLPNSTIVLSGHKDCVRTVGWNITGTRLASGSTDKTIRVWNPEKPEVRYSIQLKGHSQTIDQLCWDPTNPDHLASASPDKTVRFWDYRCRQPLIECELIDSGRLYYRSSYKGRKHQYYLESRWSSCSGCQQGIQAFVHSQ